MCVGVLSGCLSVHYVGVWCLWKLEEGIGFPGAGVIGSYKLPCVCWNLNPGSLEEQLKPLAMCYLTST